MLFGHMHRGIVTYLSLISLYESTVLLWQYDLDQCCSHIFLLVLQTGCNELSTCSIVCGLLNPL